MAESGMINAVEYSKETDFCTKLLIYCFGYW